MLKIKDNIDLKVLEKYGFDMTDKKCFKWVITKGYDIGYEIKTDNRIIRISSSLLEMLFPIDNTLYDLIKDNLVEKVEE